MVKTNPVLAIWRRC